MYTAKQPARIIGAALKLSLKYWWLNKNKETQKRDRENVIELKVFGWKVITIWTCEWK